MPSLIEFFIFFFVLNSWFYSRWNYFNLFRNFIFINKENPHFFIRFPALGTLDSSLLQEHFKEKIISSIPSLSFEPLLRAFIYEKQWNQQNLLFLFQSKYYLENLNLQQNPELVSPYYFYIILQAQENRNKTSISFI